MSLETGMELLPLEFSQNRMISLDEGEPVDVVYFDFQKAFNKVPY